MEAEIKLIFVISIYLFLILEVLLGFLLYKKTPKMNMLYGYRTKRSMASEKTWDFANKITGKIWFVLGIIQSVVFIPLVIFLDDYVSHIIMTLMPLVILLICLVIVEILLKKKFLKKQI